MRTAARYFSYWPTDFPTSKRPRVASVHEIQIAGPTQRIAEVRLEDVTAKEAYAAAADLFALVQIKEGG